MFKKFKTPFNVKPGTKKDSILSLVFVILVLVILPLPIFVDTRLVILPVALWFLSAYEMLRGLKSKEPKLAKIAKVLIVIAAIAIIACAVFIFITTIRTILGAVNG